MILKALLKPLVYKVGYALGGQKVLLNHIKKKELLPILSLHSISPHANPSWPPLHPKTFDSLLNHLKKHFEILSFHELDSPTKKPKLVLSFDDGYYDFIEYAMPILKKHGLRANQNIIPSQLLGKKPLWNIALYDFLNNAPFSLIREISFQGFDGKEFQRLDKTQFALKLSQTLKQKSESERSTIITQLETNIFKKLDTFPTTRMIRLHEMPQVLAEHEIGVHSYTHHSMGIESMPYFVQDFEKCRDFFQEHAFPTMDIYAFPNGSYREEQIDYLKQNNIKYVLLVGDQYANNFCTRYHRFNIGASSLEETIFQALGVKALWKKNGR